MKLRSQLALAAVVALAVPLAGWQFLVSAERILREGHEAGLIDAAATAALLIPDVEPPSATAGLPVLYVADTGRALVLDGFDGDWSGINEAGWYAASAGVRVRAAADVDALWLLVEVEDEDLRLATPDRAGDGLRVWLAEPGAAGVQLDLFPAAPGRFTIPRSGTRDIRGALRAGVEGWAMELRIPLQRRPSRLHLAVVDRDGGGEAGEIVDTTLALRRYDPALAGRLARVVPDDFRAWIVDEAGRVIASSSTVEARDGAEPRLAGWAASRFPLRPEPEPGAVVVEPATLDAAMVGGEHIEWFRSSDDGRVQVRVVRALSPASGGPAGLALVLQREAGEVVLAANRAVARLAGWSLLAFSAAAFVLLAFAAVLTGRIRRLQRAAEGAVRPDGRVREALPRPAARDEIGDLGRSLAELLDRQRGHQQHLREMADRLSHELRTPLAAIRTSLDNLREETAGADSQRYLDRAEQACRRLFGILRAMSSAARLEDSLADEALEPLDMAALVREYADAMRALHPSLRIEAETPDRAMIRGSTDLLLQMLDKLVENAVDFTPPGGRIVLRVERRGAVVRVEVDNDGPPIDAAAAERVFEPLVSAGRPSNDRIHLGMGLAIARLVADRHEATIRAAPRQGGTRILFEVPAAAGEKPA